MKALIKLSKKCELKNKMKARFFLMIIMCVTISMACFAQDRTKGKMEFQKSSGCHTLPYYLPSDPTYPDRPYLPGDPTHPDRPYLPGNPTHPDRPYLPSNPTHPDHLPSDPTHPDHPYSPGDPMHPDHPCSPPIMYDGDDTYSPITYLQ